MILSVVPMRAVRLHFVLLAMHVPVERAVQRGTHASTANALHFAQMVVRQSLQAVLQATMSVQVAHRYERTVAVLLVGLFEHQMLVLDLCARLVHKA